MNLKKKIAVLLNGPIKNDYRVIKVITTLSKQNQVDLFYINGTSSDQSIFNNNVNLYPVDCQDSISKKIIRNTLFYLEFNFFKAEVLAKNVRYDYVVANDLPTLLPAFKIATQLSSKLVYDSHEIYIETINQFFPREAPLHKKIIYSACKLLMTCSGKIIERKIVKRSDFMITVNSSLKDYFIKHYSPKKIDVVMNFPYSKRGGLVTGKIDFRNEYNWSNDDLIFLYQGVLNEGRGLRLMLGAMCRVNSSCKLIILGDGFIKSDLKQTVKDYKLKENVKFINKVALSDLPKYTRSVDVGVNLLESTNLSKKLASPNKLFEYIHAEIPIMCSYSIENDRVMNRYNVGFSTYNNIFDVVNVMEKFVLCDKTSFKLNCKIASKEYVWESQEALINSIFS
ncbi:glycosyltransferase [Vicingaceae bacterium]|nr:glycosyltransferase [Vicingaceae bacterium]